MTTFCPLRGHSKENRILVPKKIEKKKFFVNTWVSFPMAHLVAASAGRVGPDHLHPGLAVLHCYKYKLTKPCSGEFLVATMFKQDLNSAIKNLQEQELEKNYYKKKLCRNKY